MKAKKNLGFILISLLSLGACAQTENWNGLYVYEAELGENVAEDKVIVEYALTLNDEKCLIKSQGYQTDETIICTSEKNGNNLIVKFKSYENGATKNIYDVEVFVPDSKLFTLTSNKSTLVTTWGALAPDETFTTGEHFKKTK